MQFVVVFLLLLSAIALAEDITLSEGAFAGVVVGSITGGMLFGGLILFFALLCCFRKCELFDF